MTKDLRDEITHEEYIRLCELRAQDRYLRSLREIIFREAAGILKRPEKNTEECINHALQMCEQGSRGVDGFLDMRDIEVKDARKPKRMDD